MGDARRPADAARPRGIRREHLRVQYARRAVLAALAHGDRPTVDDLVRALGDHPHAPVPREILDYLITAYVRGTKARRPGPARGRDTAARDGCVRAWYRWTVLRLRDAEQTAEIRGRAEAETAAHFRLSPRTVRRIVADRRP